MASIRDEPVGANVESNPVHRSLDEFLAAAQARAFRMARFALGNDEDALDVVQDASWA